MNILKKIWGKILYGISSFISVIFDVFIKGIGFIIELTIGVGKGVLALISMGGCLFFIILGPALLFNPFTFTVIIFLIVFPILGTKFTSYLEYVKYMITQYLFDHADNLINNRKPQFKTFTDYGYKYRKMEEEKIRKERERRQEEQQRIWEERFRQWAEYESYQRRNYGDYSRNSQNYGYNNYANPNIEFKAKYEKSCDLLGVSYDSDKYQIKLGYRKKAKEHHPDINRTPNATQKFQEINDAYEFLSDSNIERYKALVS